LNRLLHLFASHSEKLRANVPVGLFVLPGGESFQSPTEPFARFIHNNDVAASQLLCASQPTYSCPNNHNGGLHFPLFFLKPEFLKKTFRLMVLLLLLLAAVCCVHGAKSGFDLDPTLTDDFDEEKLEKLLAVKARDDAEDGTVVLAEDDEEETEEEDK
jgi:hypothetical protein